MCEEGFAESENSNSLKNERVRDELRSGPDRNPLSGRPIQPAPKGFSIHFERAPIETPKEEDLHLITRKTLRWIFAQGPYKNLWEEGPLTRSRKGFAMNYVQRLNEILQEESLINPIAFPNLPLLPIHDPPFHRLFAHMLDKGIQHAVRYFLKKHIIDCRISIRAPFPHERPVYRTVLPS